METSTKSSENGSGIPGVEAKGTTPADIQVSESEYKKVTEKRDCSCCRHCLINDEDPEDIDAYCEKGHDRMPKNCKDFSRMAVI